MSDDTVEVSRATLSRLYGATRTLVEMDDVQSYSADINVLEEAEEVLDRDGPYS